MVRELANNESAYRSITQSWLHHSVLSELFKLLSQSNYKVIITTDHGSIRASKPVKIVGDRNTNTNLRYKLGKHCHVLETADKLPCKITALVKCPIHNNQKIPVEIGA